MKDIDLKDKDDIAVRKSSPAFSLGLIIVGVVILVIGIIAINTTDMSKYNKSKDIKETFDAKEIKNISIDVGFIDMDIKKSSSDKIEVDFENVPENIEVSTEGDTFKVRYKDSQWHIGSFSWSGSWFGTNKSSAELYLPEKVYDSFECDTGAGKLELEDISCDEFVIDTGAGDSRIYNINCSTAEIDTGTGNFVADHFNCEGVCDIDTGVGNTDFTDSTTGGLNADVGVGNLDYKGTVNGNIDADCGVGNVNIDLTNPSSDFSGGKYSINKDAGVGDIDISFDNDF